MKKETLERVNGYGMLLRFILPFMVGILILMVNDLREDVKQVQVALGNHLKTDVLKICTRLERIEEKLDIPPR